MLSVYLASSDSDFDTLYAIRNEVFVQEQGVSEDEEYDEFEHISKHYLAYWDDKPVGTCRWRVTLVGDVKLERFAVRKDFRGKKVGAALLQACLADVPKLAGSKIYLHAQIQVKDFYAKYGFEAEGEIFEEAGIQHVKMVWKGA